MQELLEDPTDEAILEAVGLPEMPKIIGPKGEEMPASGLTLAIEKFKKHGDKYYRLIWVNGATSWLAEEDTTPFRRYRDVVEVGQALAKKVGAKRFSEVTR
jgi:hypothetical protein